MNRRKDNGLRNKPAGRPNNALQAGISTYLNSTNRGIHHIQLLPKKYTVYPPLLILPVNFITTTPEWQVIYESLTQAEKTALFATIAAAFKPQTITHIAINAAISPETSADGSENVMRSPSGITPVYGDFGPNKCQSGDGQPTQVDFDAAFWVSTAQNGGIVQTWAPLWTMFSRGNITEKARILGEGNCMRGLTVEEVGDLSNVHVADLYVGIGYFCFSYLKRGIKTVLGWDINGWSVEGLRRVCEKNGWDCVVVRVCNGQLGDEDMEKVVQSLRNWHRSKCIVFWGDNQSAPGVLQEIRCLTQVDLLPELNLRHVNLGLLPNARDSWENAVRMLDQRYSSWIHVHENVDIHEIEPKRGEMVSSFDKHAQTIREGTWRVSCPHVEQVKTYAPGVMHCVFDVEITPIAAS
jgi:tRNA wybutosine-synthesizing protein 2